MTKKDVTHMFRDLDIPFYDMLCQLNLAPWAVRFRKHFSVHRAGIEAQATFGAMIHMLIGDIT